LPSERSPRTPALLCACAAASLLLGPGSALAPGTTTAFLYSPGDGSLRDLEGTVARAVNGSGVVVGDTATGAFLFDGSSTLELPDAGARGINERGVVAGYVEMENPYRPSPLPLAPALYEGTAWRILDVAKVYPRGMRQGVYADLYVLADVNEAGTAVGVKSRSGLYGSSAILTLPAFDRAVYLPISGGGRAAAINDAGDIVGSAIFEGQVHGYLLVAGGQPLTVRFDSSGSHDPNGSALAIEWSFGDGAPARRSATFVDRRLAC
jgi:hypothetical protein